MRTVSCCVLALTLGGIAVGQDPKDAPIDPKKLVGEWKPADDKPGEKVVVEFAEGGKITIRAEFGGKAETFAGTYALDGNKLNLKMTFGEAEIAQTLTVHELTDDKLVTEDEKQKKETLVRVKPPEKKEPEKKEPEKKEPEKKDEKDKM